MSANGQKIALACRRMKQKGASLTEFVIVGPVAILMTFVMIQAGLLYMGKLTLNNAVFMAARNGAVNNAKTNVIKESLAKGLIPFHQNAFEASDVARLSAAYLKSKIDVETGLFVKLDLLSPTNEAFNVYGISKNGVTSIPNDNLEFRTVAPINGSNISLRDANILKIKVTYGYELKVPLMQAIVKRIMCPFTSDSDVKAWQRPTATMPLGPDNCYYYMQGRVPLVSYATVQMQTPAQR